MMKRMRILKHSGGQGMTEYAIVCACVVLGVSAINTVIIPPLNDFFELVVEVLSMPFP